MKPKTEKRAMWNGNNFTKLYERGIAVGLSDIKRDTMTFRCGSEKFTLTWRSFMRWNGYFWEAPVKKLRAAA